MQKLCYNLTMNLLAKLKCKLSEEELEKEQINALNYLYARMEIATYRNMTMRQYFDKHYLRNCYYYSTYLILCLQPTDKLVRGEIHNGPKLKDSVPNYKHGWVEFEYNGRWWVYDDHYVYPQLLEDYYNYHAPYSVNYSFTQKELVEFIKQEFPDKTHETKIDDHTYFSTEAISDSLHKIPLPYIELDVCKNQIVQMSVDKNLQVHLI